MIVTRKPGVLSLQELAGLSWLPFLEPVIRIEDFQRDDEYVIRAEMPGVDPDKDVSITLHDGLLRLTAIRLRDNRDARRSEFRYGTLHRTVTLPPGVSEQTVAACYTNGILEITMKLGEPAEISQPVPVAVKKAVTA